MHNRALAVTAAIISALAAYQPHVACAQTPPATVYGSGASAAAVILSVLGQPAAGLPVAGSSGQGAPAYKKTAVVLGGSATVALPAVLGTAPLEVIVSTPKSSTVAEGDLLPGGGYTAYGTSQTGALTISLQSELLGVTLTYLKVSVTNLTANTAVQVDAAGARQNSTIDHVGLLSISGLLVGTPITISGPLKTGVILNTPLVKITTREVYDAVVAGKRAVILNSVDVAFGNAILGGVPLQGNIVVGSANAY